MRKKNAQEFIRVLQRTVKDLPYEDAAFKKKLMLQMIRDNPEYERAFRETRLDIDEMCERTAVEPEFDVIISNISGESAARIKRDVGLCELYLRRANACCGTPVQYCHTYWKRCGPICKRKDYMGLRCCPCVVCDEYEGSIIAIHRGLRMLFHNTIELLIASQNFVFSYTSGDVVQELEPLLSKDDAISAIYHVFRLEQQGSVPTLPPKAVLRQDGRGQILHLLTWYAYLFVVGHELAHFLLRHRDEKSIALPGYEDDQIEAFAWSEDQNKEFRADETGLAMMLNSGWGMGADIALMHAIAGSEIILLLLEIYERIRKNRPNMRHPAANDRIRNLRQKYKFPDRYYEVSNTFVTLGEKGILEEIVSRYHL